MKNIIIMPLAIAVAAPVITAGHMVARYDFEDTPIQIDFSTLQLNDNGHDLTIQMMNQAQGLWVRNNGTWFPPEWGNRSLDIMLRPNDAFVMSVQPGVMGIMFEYASNGPQAIDILWETNYFHNSQSHSGVFTLDNRLLDGDQPAQFLFSFLAPTDWLTEIRFTSLSQQTGYMGIDNITVLIPAPGPIGLLVVVGLAAGRRRRSI